MSAAIRPLLVNGHEILTDRALERAAENAGYRVAPKVRIADVLSIARSGLSDPQYRYALRAHFEFVVTEGEERVPRFAVEFDGSIHDTDPDTAILDGLKSSICEHFGFPLLRIDGTLAASPQQ